MAEIFIYGDIGESWWFDDESITGKTIANQLKEIPKGEPIDLRINSVGGDVAEALAIFNLLSERRDDVTAYVDGYALSAASFIALAANKIVSPPSSIWMIHNPSSITFGDANAMRKAADILDTHRDVLLSVYAERTGQDEADIIAALDEETWFTGTEAVDWGLATELGEDLPKEAKIENLIPYRFKASASKSDVAKLKDCGWRFQTNRHRSNNRQRHVAASYQPKSGDTKQMEELEQLRGEVDSIRSELSTAQTELSKTVAALKQKDAEIQQLQHREQIANDYNNLRRRAEALNRDAKLSKAQFDRLFAADPATDIATLAATDKWALALGRIEGAIEVAELSETKLQTSFLTGEPIVNSDRNDPADKEQEARLQAARDQIANAWKS